MHEVFKWDRTICFNGLIYRATKFIRATKEVGSGHHEWKTQNSTDAYLCQMSEFHHKISISNELLRMCTLCVRLFFSTLLQWKFIYAKTFQLFNFKTRLDGEVCSSGLQHAKRKFSTSRKMLMACLLTVILYVLHLFCDDFTCGGLILLQRFV